MYQTKSHPNNVLIWEHQETTAVLEDLAKNGNFDQVNPVLVFEVPRPYTILGGYVIFDGHNRREAARRGDVEMLLSVIEGPEDFKLIPEYNYVEFYGMDKVEFDEMVKDLMLEVLDYKQK